MSPGCKVFSGPGHLSVDEGTENDTVGSDGRFELQFHDNVHKLAAWCNELQKSLTSTNVDTGGSSPKNERLDSPRLNIAIHIVGSRGDVQPFIPIAQLLTKKPFNHRVRICTHLIFENFVREQGIEFFSIGGDPEALMSYMVRNPGLLPSRESIKAGDVGKRREEMWEILNGAWRSCIEAGDGLGEPVKAVHVQNTEDLFIADAIIANPPSMAHIHCAEKLGIPLHIVFTMPWSPTETFSHPLASMNGVNNKTANYLSFVMMELLTWQGLGDLLNKFRRQLHLEYVSPMWGFQLLPRLLVPFIYLWSQSLIPKPADWASHINITGFSFLPLASVYTPPPDLVAFLEQGPTPIYIGFGSIVIDNPNALTQLLFKAVKSAGVRAIISQGWGAVGSGYPIPEDVYIIGNCPHDWLFPRVSVVVHHGGAGTTAAGIAAGRPTVVVPFFGDQPFWGQMVARAGAGPEPVSFKEMTAESLAASIIFALKPDVQNGAQEMAKNIAQEDGARDSALCFQKSLVAENRLQCDVSPGRLASWKHKKSGKRLSGFALSCLVDQQLIQLDDVELLQHREWYVDEGAEHPLVGIAASLTSFLTTVATATSDYSDSLKKRPSHQENKHSVVLKGTISSDALTPTEGRGTALSIVEHPFHSLTHKNNMMKLQMGHHDKSKAFWRTQEQGRNGRAWYITRVTGRYTAEVTKAVMKMPVAFLYNTANGFHNFPSYGFSDVSVRRRDQITGLGSGLKVAGKESVLGLWDAISGIVTEPYKAFKTKGPTAVGKGLIRGGSGFYSNLGCAIFSIPAYTLKGLEKELSKRNLAKIKAEIMLIRLRQAIGDFQEATEEERQAAVTRWSGLS